MSDSLLSDSLLSDSFFVSLFLSLLLSFRATLLSMQIFPFFQNLALTRMISDRIGLHSVLLRFLIKPVTITRV